MTRKKWLGERFGYLGMECSVSLQKKKEETGQVKKRRDRSTKLAIAIEQYAVVMSLKKGTKI